MSISPKPKRPKVSKRPAASWAQGTIVEVTFPDGKGCLIDLSVVADGSNRIVVYRADIGIKVAVSDGVGRSLSEVVTVGYQS